MPNINYLPSGSSGFLAHLSDRADSNQPLNNQILIDESESGHESYKLPDSNGLHYAMG